MGTFEITVLDANRQFVDYVHPGFARKLLKDGLALVYSKDPFIIQVKNRESLRIKRDQMPIITNFTEYFKVEKDVLCQNVSNCQVSVSFEVGPGHTESFLFTNSKDPVNLTRFIPFHAIKGSMDLRKMLNRVPPALRLLDEAEFDAFYKKQADANGLSSSDEAMERAEARRQSAQNHTPLADAVDPVKIHEVVEDGQRLGERKLVKSTSGTVSEDEEINPRVLNLCLQVHPSLPDQQKMTAQTFLSELDNLQGLTYMDWSYIQAHSYYKSVRNVAKKMVADLAAQSEQDDEPVAKKPAKKAKTTAVSAE
jgi:hypothetical protein